MMQNDKITGSHFSRKAIVYVRQSTEVQVRVNTASPIYQREQSKHALRFGWHPAMIETVEDNGVSGCSTINRQGFLDISGRIEKGQIGAIFFHDFSRLSRNILDFQKLLEKCKIYDVLFFEDGRLIDPKDATDSFMASIRADVAQLENLDRTKKMIDGRNARIRSGNAVSTPPIGYVVIPGNKGKWAKHPDQKVQDILRLAFQKALELPSLYAVYRYFWEKRIQVPTRKTRYVYDTEVVWKKPHKSYFSRLLRNPNYTQDYHYYTRTSDPKNGYYENGVRKGQPKQRRGDPSKIVVINDHHDAYIDRETYQKLRHKIVKNRAGRFQPAGKGKNLLQGILRCGHCNKRMTNYYNVNSTKKSYYACPNYMPPCKIRSRVFNAEQIDESVLRLLFGVVGKIKVGQVVRRYEEDRCRLKAKKFDFDSTLRLLEEQAEEARKAYLEVAPENPLVKNKLEVKWQERLLALDNHRSSIEQNESSLPLLTPDQKKQLDYLCQNFEKAFRHKSVDAITRKQLVRCFIQEVVLTVESETVSIEISWKGTPSVKTCLTIQTAKYVNNYIIEKYHEGFYEQEILDAMKSDGIGEPGRVYTKRNVSRLIKDRGLESCGKRRMKEIRSRILACHKEGLGIQEMVDRLNSEGIKPLIKSEFTPKNVKSILNNLLRSKGEDSVKGAKNCEVMKALLKQGLTCTEISAELNALGLTTETGLPYEYQRIYKKIKRLGLPVPDGNKGGLGKEVKLRLLEFFDQGKSYREVYEQLRYEGVIDPSPNTRKRIVTFYVNLSRKEAIQENIPKEFLSAIYDLAGKGLSAPKIAKELNRIGVKTINGDSYNARIVNNYCRAIDLPIGRKQYLDDPALKELVESLVQSGKSCKSIAERLNEVGFRTHIGREFNQDDIHQILDRQGIKAAPHCSYEYILEEIKPLIEKGYHPRTIARMLNKKGLKTVTGQRFKIHTIQHYMRKIKRGNKKGKCMEVV